LQGKPDPTAPREDAIPVNAEASRITDLLERWVAAARAGDAAAQAVLYAPQVERYFQARNVSRHRVQRDREQAFSKAGKVQRFQIGNVHTTLQGADRALVTFDKEWQFARGGAGKSRSQLRLRKVDGEWRIASERNL
jgi:uncharacterized protein (TIGR02246 family)